jgi:hypothetical protein
MWFCQTHDVGSTQPTWYTCSTIVWYQVATAQPTTFGGCNVVLVLLRRPQKDGKRPCCRRPVRRLLTLQAAHPNNYVLLCCIQHLDPSQDVSRSEPASSEAVVANAQGRAQQAGGARRRAHGEPASDDRAAERGDPGQAGGAAGRAAAGSSAGRLRLAS